MSGDGKMRHSLLVSSSIVVCVTVTLYFISLSRWQSEPEVNEVYTSITGLHNGDQVSLQKSVPGDTQVSLERSVPSDTRLHKGHQGSLQGDVPDDTGLLDGDQESHHGRASEDYFVRKDDSHMEQPGKKVLIFTTMRSGSSFVGELFQQNPDFYYMFEPLKLVSLDWDGYLHTQQHGVRHINDLLECKFQDFLTEAQVRYSKNNTAFLTSWKRRAFCGRIRPKLCDDINPNSLEGVCKGKRHVAMKTILLNQGKTLPPILQRGAYVLHLFRDPRGMISSMKRIGFRPLVSKPDKFVSSLCRRLKNQLEYVSDHMFLQIRRYILVRYEDIALAPVDGANTLYKFLDLPLSVDVIHWIQNSTTVDRMSSRAFSTKRNSSKTVSSWRKHMKWSEVDSIQRKPECKAVLQALGYVIFQNINEYHDTSVSPIKKLPSEYAKSL